MLLSSYAKNKECIQSQQRAFIIRAPTLEATSHLTFDIPGDGPTWHFLARFATKAAATQNSVSNQCTEITDGFHRVKCRAHVSRVVKMSPPAHPPPRIVLYQRLKSMQSDLKTRFFSGPQCTKIDGQTERPLRQC